MVLPTQNQDFNVGDGVRFAFNLAALTSVPAKIRIYQRDYQSGDSWQQIGNITQFADRKGVKFARGSVVWLPPAEGDYEVQAVAIDGTGTTMASAVRRVSIMGSNQPPVIAFTTGPLTPFHDYRSAYFETSLSDPDGDTISRVEFFDNGKLIGVDSWQPFGNQIRDLQNRPITLFRGAHSITAKAYDIRGGVGQTVIPYTVIITGGNAIPKVQITSPVDTLEVLQGQRFTIDYTVTDDDGITDVTGVRAKNLRNNQEVVDDAAPFTSLTYNTTSWEPGNHTIAVRAMDSTIEESFPGVVKVYVKTNGPQSFAEKLTDNIIDSTSTTATNELFVGAEASSGEFTGGNASGLQMNEGILMATGLFASWNAGNRSTEKSWSWNLPGDDRLFARLTEGMDAGGTTPKTTDAAALEFDLLCENGQLELEFQFASEEYLEYVNNFNDGFLVTVNGVDVSLLPDGEGIVSVNSAHSFIPASISNTYMDIPAKNDHLYLDNTLDIGPNVTASNLVRLVEYDGMTVKLRSHVLVAPGQTYRVRLVIGDMTDFGVDSAIFFQKDSFKTIIPEP